MPGECRGLYIKWVSSARCSNKFAILPIYFNIDKLYITHAHNSRSEYRSIFAVNMSRQGLKIDRNYIAATWESLAKDLQHRVLASGNRNKFWQIPYKPLPFSSPELWMIPTARKQRRAGSNSNLVCPRDVKWSTRLQVVERWISNLVSSYLSPTSWSSLLSTPSSLLRRHYCRLRIA